MTSAVEFAARGVEFGYADGQPVCVVPDDATGEAVADEVMRRALAIRDQMPTAGDRPWPAPRLAPGAAVRRTGACSCCDEPLQAHVGGECPLCGAGLRGALRLAGRLK